MSSKSSQGEPSADERGTAAGAVFLIDCLEMDPRSRQCMHCNRNTSKVDALYANVGRPVGVCGDLVALVSLLDRKKALAT